MDIFPRVAFIPNQRPLAGARRLLLAIALAASPLLGPLGGPLGTARAADWPELPRHNGAVEIPAQEWQFQPGPRTVRILIHYPGGELTRVNERTGIMLSLHNWGGVDCVGTADPLVLAERLNVVAVCVNYLQSGRESVDAAAPPYDFGYLQALDALRALWFVYSGLQRAELPFDAGRIFTTGGSGGGNVSLMAGKLAPRTFACVVDMCGMVRLSDDVAFGLEGGSRLNARWSSDADSPYYLRPDDQELRFVGHPDHLRAMVEMGSSCRVVVVHGRDDDVCPFAEAEEMVQNMRAAGLSVVPHFVSRDDLDGEIFTSSGHPLGNRTEIVFRAAGSLLAPEGPSAVRRDGPSDFDLREEVVYPTTGGRFVISYRDGFPVGRFEPRR